MRTAILTLSDDTRLPHVRRQMSALPAGVTHYRAVLGPDLNLARARNAVADHACAAGEELLIFLDADCIPGPDLIPLYQQAAARFPEDILCGPVTYLDPPSHGGYDLAQLQPHPHPARPNPAPGEFLAATHEEYNLFWSLSFAMTAAAWQEGPHFDESYTGYGGEDTDFAYQQREYGRTLRWVGGAHAFHQWHPVSSPPVEHVDDIVVNARRFFATWGVWPMSGWLRAFDDMGLVEWKDTTLTRRSG